MFLTCGRGYACVFLQDSTSPVWIPDRLTHHVTVPWAPGSPVTSTTKEKEHASATHLKSPADSKTTSRGDPGRTNLILGNSALITTITITVTVIVTVTIIVTVTVAAISLTQQVHTPQ